MNENKNECAEVHEKLFNKLSDEIHKRQLSNSENYDKTILTYSGFGLSLSMAFIKDIVPLAKAVNLSFLYVSWVFFILAIICVIISYFMSQKGLERQLEIAECYYLKNCSHAENLPNIWSKWTDIINYISGILFICGVSLNTYFCYINISNLGDRI